MAAVSMHEEALQFAAEEMKGDCEIVMTAVSQDGLALQFATEELKGNRKIVMAAVSRDGFALQHAAEWLKGDREIVMTAVSKNGAALRFATKELKDDEEILQHALERSRNCSNLVGLQVVLLSGRCCSEVFGYRADVSMVLRRCAASLDLDPEHVERNGTLMRGPTEVKHLREFEPGKLHEITLVLSWCSLEGGRERSSQESSAECTKIAPLSAVPAPIVNAPRKPREFFFRAPRCTMSL